MFKQLFFVKQYFIALCLLFLGCLGLVNEQKLYAQNIAYDKDNIKFFSLKSGLSEGTVTSIVQDYKGVLWFGTRNGLNRYNGIGFSIYEHDYEDSTSLSNSYINCLFEDSRNNLWVGTAHGLNLYNRNEDTFIRFQYSSDDNLSISHNTVYTIFEDSNNIIWIGTEEGLNRYDPKQGTFSRFIHNSKNQNSLGHNYIRTIFEDNSGNIWIGTYGGGLDRFEPETSTFVHYRFDEGDSKSISSNHIRTAFKDKDGDIWIGTKGGLNRLQQENGVFTFKRYLHDLQNRNSIPHNIISAISEDDHGNLWIGTENGGLSLLHKKSDKFTNYLHDPLDRTSISNNSLWAIYKDNVGTMWLGMFNTGITKWDKYQNKFNHYNVNSSGNSLSNGNVTCFFEDENQNLWIGTDGGGFNYFDRQSKKFTPYLHDPENEHSLGSNAVTAILKDSQKNLWIGTWEGGLNKYDPEKNRFKRYTHCAADSTSISSNNVFTLLEDSRGRLWIGAFEGGLDLFDRKTQTFKHFKHDPDDATSLVSNKVFKIFEDSRQNIWIGTEGGGLSLLQTNEAGEIYFTNFRHNPGDYSSLGGNSTINIIEDHQHNLWIGTYGGGLSKYLPESNTFKTYRKEQGLLNNIIHGLLEDDFGNLWISTNDGISKFDIDEETFRNYTVADGLQSQEFIRGAAYKTSSGELLFGGVNGFNAFYPQEVVDNPHIPPVYITDLKIYGKQVKPGRENSPLKRHITDTEEIVLNHDQNVFSFEISALNYAQASENQYAYKLEGYDKDWQYIGNRRNVYYTKVPQGNYVFKVKGSNNDGVWNETGTAIRIIINPPWYATWWAYTVYFLIVVSLFYLYQKNLIHRERLKSDLKLEQLELSKMQEVDQMKSNFFANISHEFRTPLTLILGPLKSMYSGRFEGDLKSQLKMMIRNGDRLLRLINQLMDLSKLGAGNMKLKAAKQDISSFIKPIISSFVVHAKNQGIALSLNQPEKPLEVYFDADKLEKIIVNLLSNALKFTGVDSKVEVNISSVEVSNVTTSPDKDLFEAYLLLEVKDNGIGIHKDELPLIFNRFYQVDTGQHSDIKGTGIGLSLTKELVELHQGFIEVESEPNVGTTFKVYLPLGSNHLSQDEISLDALSDKGVEDLEIIAPEDKKSAKKAKTEYFANTRKQWPSILIVEDNDDLRHYIANHLRDNYNIIEAADGNAGFEMVLDKSPDLIISDVMMPGINGYELCKKIKSDERTRHIPFLLLTAKVTDDNQREGLETGADYYMTKPFDAQVLVLSVRNIIKSREILQDFFSGNKKFALEPKKVNIDSSEEKFLKKAIECMEENMSNSDFGVEDFGEALGLSRMQLYRKLKALTGQSANEFIRSIRMRRAVQLLETGELTIAEITYEVGFNDLKHFRTCFKKEFGVNPSQFNLKSPTV